MKRNTNKPHTKRSRDLVEDSRRVDNKLIYQAEASLAAARHPLRGLPRRRVGKNKSPNAVSFDEAPATSSASYKREEHGGYNGNKDAYLDSPRRNGLTPRLPGEEDEEEEELLTHSSKLRRLRDADLQQQQRLSGGGGVCSRGQQQPLCKPLSAYVQEQHAPVYSCSFCGAKFHIKSLLGAHRRTHDDDFKVRFRTRRRRDSSSATLPASGNLCRYCDRKFDLERTLHIHQLCHCKKIPPQQRRKLAYTELLHEKKAPLPVFQRQQHDYGIGAAHVEIKQQQQLEAQVKAAVTGASLQAERWR